MVTRRMDAYFHCMGAINVDSSRFIKSLGGVATNGAPIRRNHAGVSYADMPSRPVAVWQPWIYIKSSNR